MRNIVKKLVEKLLEKPLRKLARWAAEQNAAADAAREAEASGGTAATDAGGMGVPASPSSEAGVSFPLAGSSSENPPPSSKPWRECRKSSNWNGSNAQQRMMNMLSPKFDDKKFGDYLAWIIGRGCDHAHVFLVNEGDGEGAGYDCCTDAKANALALERLRTIRSKGLGIVLWIVADDSPNYRAKLFSDPAKYARGAANLLPYASAIVVGLEMNEGKPAPSEAQWKAVRSAFKSFANVPFGVHHTSGNEFRYASLGDFICGQLATSCSAADIRKQIAAIKAKGKDAVGFEYARQPDRAKAQAALDAGSHAVGNW